jgi:indolepyruvate ferredoxin oxidoreductase
MPIARDFSLDAKYRLQEGVVFLSGIQALVRLPLDQHRADRRRGLNTGTMISGYRGSPLGGLDLTLERNLPMLAEHNVVFISGVNEDLGATVVYGSQLANYFPQPKYDGVLGMWYGKGPGVDRTGDIFKHANFAGIAKNGGVLALGGDDPLSKSSTLPTHSEVAFYDAQFPVLFPGSVQEILDMGRLGFELSRYSGLWVGFKIVTNVADEIGTRSRAAASPSSIRASRGAPWGTAEPDAAAALHLEMEREIHPADWKRRARPRRRTGSTASPFPPGRLARHAAPARPDLRGPPRAGPQATPSPPVRFVSSTCACCSCSGRHHPGCSCKPGLLHRTRRAGGLSAATCL